MAADLGESPGTGSSEHPASDGTGSGSQAAASASQGQRRRLGGGRCSQQREQAAKAVSFAGRCRVLAGHVYDNTNPCQVADQYTKTTREICEYVGRTYQHGADTKITLETLVVPTFPVPANPATGASHTAVELWEKMVLSLIHI